MHRRDHVALGLGHLLAIGVEYPARDGGVAPRQGLVVEVRAQDRREQPGADDVVRLRTQFHREHLPKEIFVFAFAAGDLRRQR